MPPCPQDLDLRDLWVHGHTILHLLCFLTQPLLPTPYAKSASSWASCIVYAKGKLSQQQLRNI